MKTLFISDLDGTLLNQDAKLSEYTKTKLQSLIEQGISFTCATARTAASVTHILSGVSLSAPAILMNGVAIYDWYQHHYIKVEYITPSVTKTILDTIKNLHTASFVYTIWEDNLITHYETISNDAMQSFYQERVTRYKKPYKHIHDFSLLNADSIAYYLFLDTSKNLAPMYQVISKLKETTDIDFCYYKDVYFDDIWCLEVFSNKATKYNAANYIKDTYGYDYLIGFGDNLNDLPLFEACDEAYAVGNAKEELKKVATDVIGTNIEDSVVNFMEQSKRKDR